MADLRVIISAVGPYHAHEAARAAHRAGYLERFIIGVRDPAPTDIPPAACRRVLPPAYIGYAMQQIPHPGSLYFSYGIRDNLFDRWASRYITPCEVFHGWNHQCLHSLRKAKVLGARVIVTRSSAHPLVQDRILREEYARFGIRHPRSATRLIAKHLQEYEEADFIDVCSEFVKRTMIEQGIPERKLRLLHVGFNPERFKPLPKGDDVFRLVFAGAISVQKGVHYLLEAFKRLNLPGAELLLVGGKTPDSRLFLPDYEGLYRHVPFVPQDRLAGLYSSGSVFVLPSLQEGFGMVVAEAAATGLPVIITENVGAPIRDGQDGYIVPIRDVEALMDRILRLYEDEHLRAEMGRSAREYIQRFTWERYYEGLIQMYQEAAAL